MIKLSKSYLISVATLLLILLAVAKTISLSVWWFLPSDGVEFAEQNNYKSQYQRVDFNNMLTAIHTKSQSRVTKKNNSKGISITNMVLKGLYGKSFEGFAILALKSSVTKTSIVSVGEEFSGYTLKEILSNGVVFTKKSKEYILLMDQTDSTKLSKSFIKPIQNTSGEVITSVSRKNIKSYADNPKKIWDDIALAEVKNGNNTKGFKVTKMKKNSEISKLGLQQNDVIIRVNNIDMSSYKDAINIYKNIDNLSSIGIVVLRNNQEKELVYDIN